MSDVERIAQAKMLAYEMRRAIDGGPFTAPETFRYYTISGSEAITQLVAALARRDAAIQAVQDECDKADAANISVTHSGARWPTTVSANRVRVAIAAEMESEQ